MSFFKAQCIVKNTLKLNSKLNKDKVAVQVYKYSKLFDFIL